MIRCILKIIIATCYITAALSIQATELAYAKKLKYRDDSLYTTYTVIRGGKPILYATVSQKSYQKGPVKQLEYHLSWQYEENEPGSTISPIKGALEAIVYREFPSLAPKNRESKKTLPVTTK